MPLASLEDVRTWLAEDKLEVDNASIVPFNVEAERLIKAMLSGVFTSSTLNAWVDSDTTPPLIASIAGKLVAAYIYREAYSEDESSVPPYAQTLYSEAVSNLKGIRSGELIVLDDTDIPVSSTQPLTSDDFWPNDTTSGPAFTMDQKFG